MYQNNNLTQSRSGIGNRVRNLSRKPVVGKAAPRRGNGTSWIWPEREDLSFEFTRLLGAAQDGGSTVAECLAAIGSIDTSDDWSWYREWKKVADTNRKRGDAAREADNTTTARSNWLRAMNYYLAAIFPFEIANGDQRAAIQGMRRCAHDYLRYRNTPGEIVSIAWPGAYPLEGYFLPAAQGGPNGSATPAPTVICIGEPGQRKEKYLYKHTRHACERGLSLLAVDLLGSEGGDAFEKMRLPDLESAIRHIMDYLVERHDVDKRRIAILADGWGSSFVARGIASDDRFAAAVCDGGIWDLHERAFFRDRIARLGADVGRAAASSNVARNIRCPVLIPTGERGWLKADRVKDLYSQLKAEGQDVTLKIFTSEETAAIHAHADNPTLANEFIFDWIAARLGSKTH
jgi:dienelactone hydrolase